MSRFSLFWCKLNARYINVYTIVKPFRFVFCVIIMAIPSIKCFPSFLTISYRSHGVSACFSWCFYNFLGCFYCFPSVFPPVSYFRFWSRCNPQRLINDLHVILAKYFSNFYFKSYEKKCRFYLFHSKVFIDFSVIFLKFLIFTKD